MRDYATTTASDWRFRREIIAVRLPRKNAMVIVGSDTAPPMKLTGLSCDLGDALRQGGSKTDLLSILRLAHPDSTASDQEAALLGFMEKLRKAGFLASTGSQTAQERSGHRRQPLPNPDSMVAPLGSLAARVPGPIWWMTSTVLTIVAVTLIATVLVRYGPWWFLNHLHGWQWVALAGGAVLHIVLHELGHSIVCRAHGCPISGAGFFFRRPPFPSFYINTSAMHLFEERSIHVAVPLAGPVTDLLVAGTLAALVLLSGASAQMGWAQALMFLTLGGFLSNINPFRASDACNLFIGLARPARPTAPGSSTARPAYPPQSGRLRTIYLSYAIAYGCTLLFLLCVAVLLTYIWVSRYIAG